MVFFRLVRNAVAASALIVSTHGSAAPLAYGNYYDETFSAGCNSSICRINFGQTPSDKLVLIRKIHCSFISSAALLVVTLHISATSGGVPIARDLPLQFLPSPPLPQSNTDYYYTVDASTQWLVGQGRFPYIQFSAVSSASMNGDCTLIGDLVTPIQ